MPRELCVEMLHLLRELLVAARFAGLPYADARWLDRAVRLVSPRSPRWTGLPRQQIGELTRVCEPAMRRLYGDSW